MVRIGTYSVGSSGRDCRYRGFTLLELLIVMLMMVAIISTAVPQFSRLLTSFELHKTTRQVAAILRETRNEAITEAQGKVFVIDEENRYYTSTISERMHTWSADIDIDFADKPVSDIRFYPDGTSSGGVVAVYSETRGFRIEVDWLTGRVHVH